jgi:hypothetical protein
MFVSTENRDRKGKHSENLCAADRNMHSHFLYFNKVFSQDVSNKHKIGMLCLCLSFPPCFTSGLTVGMSMYF